MRLRTVAEIGGALGWLIVAFGSPLLLAMYSSTAGNGAPVDGRVDAMAVAPVQLASLSIPKAAAAQPAVEPPANAKPSSPDRVSPSKRATPSTTATSRPAVKAPTSGRRKPSLEAVQKGALVGGKRGRKRPCTGARSPDIQRGDGASWKVSRGLVNHYATHLKEFDALGYAVSHETDGGDKGMRVGGIRCDNDLHQAGLRNGDVVLAVNGREVTSWVKALWLYNTINKNRDIVLTVLRRGEKRELTYRLI